MRRILLFVMVLLSAPVPASATVVLPPGFSEELVVGSFTEIPRPTAARFHPLSGDLWITEKGGGSTLGTSRVRVRRADTGGLSTALSLPCVDSLDERGIQDLTFDPEFAANSFVYLFYTRRYEAAGACAEAGQPDGSRNVVIRYTELARQLTNGVPIFSGPLLGSIGIHNGGTLRFLPDATLLISMGDGGEDPVFSQPSRDPGDLRGKILRITRSGAIPPDNPFVGVPGARPEVWAMGFRNPYRFTVDPASGNVLLPDVGDLDWEEVNLGIPGADYGWPCFQANAPHVVCDPAPAPSALTFPILTYAHYGGTFPITGEAIIGGPIYDGTTFPAEYQGSWFFADHTQGWLRRARLSATGRLEQIEVFLTGLDRPVDLSIGPDGCLYYVLIGRSEIHRVCYLGGTNGQPVASATAAPTGGLAPLTVTFDAATSSDPDGDPLATTWDFGDGTFATEPGLYHTYTAAGVYWAGLTVDDQTGSPNAIDLIPPVRIVAGNRRPGSSLTAPVASLTYRAGDTIAFAGSGSDPEEGVLPPERFSWTVTFLHGTHAHPFLGPIMGIASGSFTIASGGEGDPNAAYQIRMEVTDLGLPVGQDARLTSSRTVVLQPQISRLTLAVDPPLAGLEVEFDGVRELAPHVADSVVAWNRTIGVPAAQSMAGRTFTFGSWSDEGARAHTIPAPPADTMFTARLICPTLSVPDDLAVELPGAGVMRLVWAASSDPCLADEPGKPRYAIYRAASAGPVMGAGDFPFDPSFTLVATTGTPSIDLIPGPGAEFYLVMGVGRDGMAGPNGHYPQSAGVPVP